jgi:hypothetical protein
LDLCAPEYHLYIIDINTCPYQLIKQDQKIQDTSYPTISPRQRRLRQTHTMSSKLSSSIIDLPPFRFISKSTPSWPCIPKQNDYRRMLINYSLIQWFYKKRYTSQTSFCCLRRCKYVDCFLRSSIERFWRSVARERCK